MSSKAILIAGPTASGKSALALNLAEQLGGTIINADSMQVYRDLRIITARPSTNDEALVSHRLYGHVDAAENYSVGRWCVDAGRATAEALAAGRIPILVGGTGLYFRALIQGLAAIPPVPAHIRSTVRERLKAEGVAPLYAELARLDPAGAQRLMPGDRSRITRALEVVLATSRSIGDWHRDGMKPVLESVGSTKVFLTLDREKLHRRIDQRFETMLDMGALDEVDALRRRHLDPALPAMKAHGVPWLIRHLNGEITLAEAVEAGKRDTRRYTKRQVTWFRNQMPDWVWATPEGAGDEILRALVRRGALR